MQGLLDEAGKASMLPVGVQAQWLGPALMLRLQHEQSSMWRRQMRSTAAMKTMPSLLLLPRTQAAPSSRCSQASSLDTAVFLPP